MMLPVTRQVHLLVTHAVQCDHCLDIPDVYHFGRIGGVHGGDY